MFWKSKWHIIASKVLSFKLSFQTFGSVSMHCVSWMNFALIFEWRLKNFKFFHFLNFLKKIEKNWNFLGFEGAVKKNSVCWILTLRNTAAVCGVLCHGCEQAFGSLWQFGALAKAPSQNANRPIGVRIVLKYRLNKAYTNVNRHVMMYLLCCLMYNTTHKKFSIKYATEEGQMFIFDQIKLLLPITFV